MHTFFIFKLIKDRLEVGGGGGRNRSRRGSAGAATTAAAKGGHAVGSCSCSVATASGCLLLLMVLRLRRHDDLSVYLFVSLSRSLLVFDLIRVVVEELQPSSDFEFLLSSN